MGTSITSTGVTFPDATTQTTAATSAFSAGTVMLFAQTSAPTGWTKDTTNYNNSAIRIVTGTVSTGGSVDFTTAFASQTPAGTVSVSVSAGTLAVSAGTLAASNGTLAVTAGTLATSATTLATTQIPSHTHSYTNNSFDHSFDYGPGSAGGSTAGTTGATGGGGSHTHSLSGAPALSGSVSLSGSPSLSGAPSVTSSTFSGTAINLAVKYVDVIRATKN